MNLLIWRQKSKKYEEGLVFKGRLYSDDHSFYISIDTILIKLLGKREPTDLIKTLVRKYEGGSVDLVKSKSGIAHVILNNPERRNAISGSMMVDFLEVNNAKLEDM